MRITGSNAGYTMFRGSVKGTGYPLHSPVSPSLPLLASPCEITFQLESTTVPSSAEEVLQNMPVKTLKSDNPTTGLPSGRLATGSW